MAKKLNAEQVKELKSVNRKGEIKFGKEISELKKGEGLMISDSEWDMKTTIPAYYYGKFRKGVEEKERQFSYRKVDGGYIIEKL